ncbi:Cytochrome c oxidase subunit 5B, mitochondrial [Taxawa tesnikishii (nom. ined.)]|nr:Cytochrome c oxidase subunit 5B, mitochondrial [Dothideales sp. JES 119]
MLRSSIVRATGSASRLGLRASHAPAVFTPLAQQARQAHAISNPTLANIEKRWEQMPPQEQADLWMALRDRMKVDWHELTLQEKKAAYYIAFGPHGPRRASPPGENAQVFWYTIGGLVVSFILFAGGRQFAGPPPKTMTIEYQQASDEYLKEQKVEPITGIAAEDFKGSMMVQRNPQTAGYKP